MNLFNKIIDEPLFFRWVFNNNPEMDHYWEDYFLAHPEDVRILKSLKEQMQRIKYQSDNLSEDEKRLMSEKIIRSIELASHKKSGSKVIYRILRIAAVSVCLLGISGLIVKNVIKREKAGYDVVVQAPSADSINEPVLVLSKGQNIGLKNNNSTLDYTHSGNVLVNRNSLIKINKGNAEPEIHQLIIPFGNRSVITLSDNTIVTLNAGSKLVFPSFFKGKVREVTLLGEAFFVVSKNQKKPFVVKTASIDVTVLGTEFNVTAYSDENTIQTVLKEGSVSVRRNDAGSHEKEILLKPSQMAVFNKTEGKTEISEVDVDSYTLWTRGILRFDQFDFSRIIKKIERYYNIRVDYRDSMFGTIKISGKLDLTKNKEEVIEYLAKVSGSSIVKLNDQNYMIR